MGHTSVLDCCLLHKQGFKQNFLRVPLAPMVRHFPAKNQPGGGVKGPVLAPPPPLGCSMGS